MDALKYYEEKANAVDLDRWTSVLIPSDARSVIQSLGPIAAGNLQQSPYLSQLMSALFDLSATLSQSSRSQQQNATEIRASLSMGSLLSPGHVNRLMGMEEERVADASKKADVARESLADCPKIIRIARGQITKKTDFDLRSDLDRLTVELDKCLAVRTKVQGGEAEKAFPLAHALGLAART